MLVNYVSAVTRTAQFFFFFFFAGLCKILVKIQQGQMIVFCFFFPH